MLASFTTRIVKPAQRIEFWRQFVCDHVADVDCSVENKGSFHGEIKTYPLGRLSLSMLTAAPHRVGRSGDRITRARNDYFLAILQMSGRVDYEQNGRKSELGPGDFVLYDPRMPYDMNLKSEFTHITLRLPRDSLVIDADLNDLVGVPVRATSLGGEIVHNTIRSIHNRLDRLNPEQEYLYSEIVVDLVRSALLDTLKRSDIRLTERGRGSILARAKRYIIKNIDCENLSVSAISDHVGVSRRHLSRLFRQEGLTASHWIKGMRLARCASVLVDSKEEQRSISEIAYCNGFSDLSHFSRDFKKEYGLTPREYRITFPVRSCSEQ